MKIEHKKLKTDFYIKVSSHFYFLPHALELKQKAFPLTKDFDLVSLLYTNM